MKKSIMIAGVLSAAGFIGLAGQDVMAKETGEELTYLTNGDDSTSTDPVAEDETASAEDSSENEEEVIEDTEEAAEETAGEESAEETPKVNNKENSDEEAAEAEETVRADGMETATGEVQNGWNSTKDMYFENGVAVTGQKYIDGHWYCFDLGSGLMMKNDIVYLGVEYSPTDPKSVYYNSLGQMQYGQQYINGYWYCFNIETGKMFANGEFYLDENYQPGNPKYCYYDNQGRMVHGKRVKVGSTYRYYDKVTGKRATKQFISEGSSKFYFDDKGNMAVGEKSIGGFWYLFGTDGVMKTGFQDLKASDYSYLSADKTVYYGADGKMLKGQQYLTARDENKKYWYCFRLDTGEMMTGERVLSTDYQPQGTKTVLYNSKGQMLYGWQNGYNNYYDPTTGAKAIKSLKSINGAYYYFDVNGKKAKGEACVNGTWMLFDLDNGKRITGWQHLTKEKYNVSADKWVYYSPSTGGMLKGQQYLTDQYDNNKYWYCFSLVTGGMLYGEVTLSKEYSSSGTKTVLYDSNYGRMLYGIQTVGDVDKFYDPVTGALQKNKVVTFGGKVYFCNKNGIITDKNFLCGIDISHWQSGINIADIAAEFIICKATGGTGYLDPSFNKYANAILDSGKLLGFYHFADDGYKGDPITEATFFYNNVKNFLGKGIPILDWEVSHPDPVGWCKSFLDKFYELSGVKCMIYMNAATTRAYDWSPVANAGYTLWLAQYATTNIQDGYLADPWRDSLGNGAFKDVVMHQYSSTGRLEGYNGNLDMDIFYGNINDWMKLCQKAISK